ncbi:rhodanese-like domain-containing protein [Jejuia spongiicola]|uniref:Rhodanese-like domain-containing protein n=1 Tax=Jejuia spongiicola TaxID=2942207 RepID=A0ABT0QBJ3_9FLAO|nr:rhodanese-like domain-containing protein [Jejuia spongiicola]MCL6294306.1 rhodanese-like domain-containing protein [Jejuia spongiicola]
MKKIVIFLVLLVVATIIVSYYKKTKSDAKVVSAEDLQPLLQLDNVQLIDVRTPKEFKGGHIENAQNINFLSPDFTESIKKLDKNKPLIVYCRSGKRSAKSIKKLFEAGFTEIYDLEGGIIKWKQKGFNLKSNL